MKTLVKLKEREDSVLVRTREEGKKKFYNVPFKNYFYIKECDLSEAEIWIDNYIDHTEIVVDRDNQTYAKIFLNDNTKRYYIQSILENREIEHFEIDINAEKRLILDEFKKTNQENLRFAFIDIETFDLNPLTKNIMGVVRGEDPILSFAIKDLEGNLYFEKNKGLDDEIFDEYKTRYKEFIEIRYRIDEINALLKEINKKENEITEINSETEIDLELKKQKKDLEEEKSLLYEDYKGLKGFIDTQKALVLQKLFESEKELLLKYKKIMLDYDVALAYNGWGFDFPYLKDRFEQHLISYEELFIVDSDYMEIVKTNTYGERQSNSLQSVANDELAREFKQYQNNSTNEEGEESEENLEEITNLENIEDVGKVDWKKITKAKKIFDLFVCYPIILEEYNIQDVNLLCLIENKLNLLKIHVAICEECGCLFNESIFTSKSLDIAFLREFTKHKLISPSKPNKITMDSRKDKFTGIFPGGGYTFAYLLGLFLKVKSRDYKSFYPTTAITYEISPEAFVKTIPLNLELVFNPKEIEYILNAVNAAKEFLDGEGKVKKAKYDEYLLEKQKEFGVDSMETLMFKFIKNYKNEELTKTLKENNWVSTPADINYDTRGWKVYPHYVFRKAKENERNIYPKFVMHTINTRDEKKYEKKKYKEGTHEYESMDRFEQAIKKIGNGSFGFFTFKACRYFMEEVANAITSSCRSTIKKTIVLLEENGTKIVNGDTDACNYQVVNNITEKELDEKLFNFFEEITKPYNCSANVFLTSPYKLKELEDLKIDLQQFEEDLEILEKKEALNEEELEYQNNLIESIELTKDKIKNFDAKEKTNHFIVFEFEKEYQALIVIAKKRYYYKVIKSDGSIKYDTKGGAFKKTDTLKIAGDFQKELVIDILDGKFDKDIWKEKIMDMRNKIYNKSLSIEKLFKIKGLKRPIHEYGQPMIDKKTGEQKKTKDGKLRFAPIPAHVQVADQMEKNGEIVELNDKIRYIVKERIGSGKKIVPISQNEFYKDKIYDSEYYWDNFESTLKEILEVVYPDLVNSHFMECWNDFYKVKKVKKTKKTKNIVEKEIMEEEILG